MSGNVLPRSTLKVPLSLGIGRYVCQLKRLTFKFCKTRPDSLGVRDFIESEIVNFARANPSVVFYVKPRRMRAPLLVAEYCESYSIYVCYLAVVLIVTLYLFSKRELAISTYGQDDIGRDS